MEQKIQPWQWPNVTGIDAALIAVAWLHIYSTHTGTEANFIAHIVLGLSVWLTYASDRLFDVRKRSLQQLKTLRHRWAKRNGKLIWSIWWIALCLNLALATQLTVKELQFGLLLLAITLAYTILNQILSKRFFPKELFVAGIFALGPLVFNSSAFDLLFYIGFAGLCFLNCLTVSLKEVDVDRSMNLHTIASDLRSSYLIGIPIAGVIFSAVWSFPMRVEIALGYIIVGLLHFIQRRIKMENYRVLVDTSLLICLIPNIA